MAAQKHFSQDNNNTKKEINTQLGITKYTHTHTLVSQTNSPKREYRQFVKQGPMF